jgi:hypothetical protein
MKLSAERRGMLLFGLILLGMLGISLIAFQMTGDVGIEERFASALGFPADQENQEKPGVFIEGNAIAYGAVLACLVLVCLILYRRPE